LSDISMGTWETVLFGNSRGISIVPGGINTGCGLGIPGGGIFMGGGIDIGGILAYDTGGNIGKPGGGGPKGGIPGGGIPGGGIGYPGGGPCDIIGGGWL